MTIRDAKPEDATGIARVHVESWQTTYPGIMPHAHLEALSREEFTQTWADNLREKRLFQIHVVVAETAAAGIIGFASGGVNLTSDLEYQAEVYTLYLLQSQQGQGTGRRLLQALAVRLAGAGYRTLLIWVNAQNPARRFYEALGGVATRTGQREIKSVIYDDIGYGWDEAAFHRLIRKP